jgi:hypothetical protein
MIKNVIIFAALFVILIANTVNGEVIKLSVNDEFKNQITFSAKVKSSGRGGLLKVYVRNCGMVDVLTNDQGVSPKPGMNIEYYQLQRCLIANWRVLK